MIIFHKNKELNDNFKMSNADGGQGITESWTQRKGLDYRCWAGDYRFIVTAQGMGLQI